MAERTGAIFMSGQVQFFCLVVPGKGLLCMHANGLRPQVCSLPLHRTSWLPGELSGPSHDTASMALETSHTGSCSMNKVQQYLCFANHLICYACRDALMRLLITNS